MRLKLNKYNPESSSSSSNSDSDSSSDSNSSSSSDSSSDSEAESNQGGNLPLTPASPDGKSRTPSSASNSSDSNNDSFHTAGDRTPEGEDDDRLNLIRISIPPKPIFKPKPRTIIKDPRLLGYQNLEFNFAKEWEKLYSDAYITPTIPLVPRRNYTTMFDPRQYAKAPKRTLTAELITGRSKQTLDIAKIMSGMNDTHMKVTPTGDMKTKPRGTSNVKHGVRIVRTPGTPAAKPTRDPRRPRITVPTPKPIPPVASTRGISKRRIIFLPSRATTIKNPPLAISQASTDEIHDRDLTEPCETWLDNTPSTAEAGKTTNTETETEKEIKKRNCHPLQIPSSSDNIHYKVKVRINYRIIYFKSASAAYNASSDDVHYKVKARIINRLIYFKPASTVKVNKTQVNYQTTAYKNGPQMNYAKIASSVFKVKVKTNFTLTSDPAGSHTNYFKKLARTNISKLNILNSIVPLQQPLFADQYRTPTARHTATRNDPDAQARSTSNRDEYSSPTPHCTPTARQAANSKVTNGKDRPTPDTSQADKFHNPTPTNATKEKNKQLDPDPVQRHRGEYKPLHKRPLSSLR